MSASTRAPDALASALSTRDLTDPSQGSHALQLLVVDAVAATQVGDVRLIRTGPVVAAEDNYDRLGYAPDAVARDARYTRYVSDTRALRTQTSAAIPPALLRLAAEPDPPGDVLIAAPGICYRRDAIDRLHTGTPQQLDLWVIRAGGRPLDEPDLAAMVDRLVASLLPGGQWRWAASQHPYTVGGRQVDVVDGGRPVEVAECGLAAPHVLARAGLDPRRWSGLALGMGLDRMLMLRKGIPDIRLLRSDDLRVARQMLDLAPYRAVSALPPARRDISVAVESGADDETVGDRVRDALGEDADLVEEVRILTTTMYRDVPPAARRRLGMRPGQDNVLLRVVVRPMDRTLTGTELNTLRDRIYAAVHQGAHDT
ncbi:MAG: hypothetical protein ACRDWI_00570 [Jiangellaceae bacterium]